MKLIDKLAWINIVDGRLLVARSHGQRAFYVPGGKREQGEGDADALAREVREELAVRIVKNGIRHVLTHEAEAHGKSGTTVRLTCYGAEHEGNIVPSSEIEEITWVTAEDDGLLSEGARGVVEDLAAQGLVRRESPEPRAILFDLDDTLVQTRVVKWKHHQEVARRFYGIDLTEDALSEAWGMPFDAMIARLYQDSAPVDQMRADNQSIAADYLKTEIGGAVRTVTTLLDRGVEVGVVTSTNTEFAVADLERLGFPTHRLLGIQGADRSSFHKPDGRVFSDLLSLLSGKGIGASETVYVGDSLADRTAALAAGLDYIGIESDLPRDAAPEGHRPQVLPSVADVATAFGEH